MIRSCAKTCSRGLLAGVKVLAQSECRRMLSLFEHEGMQVLKLAGISVPEFDVATSADEAYEVARRLGGKNLTVKAEVLEFVGDRTKGMFDSGLRGCVHFVFNPHEAKYIASKMLNAALTDGIGPERTKLATCSHVLVRRRSYATRKARISIQLEPDQNGPVITGCKIGVSDCRECKIPKHHPCPIMKIPVDIQRGLTRDDAHLLARSLEFKKPTVAADALLQLYAVFINNHCKSLEIFSLTEDINGEVLCYDCNMIIDDDARLRLGHILSPNDSRWRTYQSPKVDPRYSDSMANVACIVNGSGLGMASMDSIHTNGANASRCEEVGGGGTHVETEQMSRTLRSMLDDSKIHAIFLNIFDARSTDEMISRGIAQALVGLSPRQAAIPIVLRLHGAERSSGQNVVDRLMDSVLQPIYASDDFDEAVKLTVDLANNVAHQRIILASHHSVVPEAEKASALFQAAASLRPKEIENRV